MRWTLLITAVVAGSALASDPGASRPATDAEADFFYLSILNSQPVGESMQMLTDVGVDKARARDLLKFLDEQMADRKQQSIGDTVRLCRNLDGRFSNPLALARELQRQEDSQDEFAAGMVRAAEGILGVASLTSVRGPHMKTPGLSGPTAVDLVLEGQIEPADAIRRACEVTKGEQARFLDQSQLL